MLAPVLEELDQDLGGKVKIGKINIDDEMDLAAQFQVASIPTLILFQNGQAVRRTVGRPAQGQSGRHVRPVIPERSLRPLRENPRGRSPGYS